MDCILKKLNCVKADINVLKRLCCSWPKNEALKLALDSMMLLVDNIYHSIVERPIEKFDIPLAHFKHQLLSQTELFGPYWVAWDADPTSVIFCHLSKLTKCIEFQSYVKIKFEWNMSEQRLILICTSNLHDLNLRFRLKPHELQEKVLAILRCCCGSSVFLERRDLSKWKDSVKVIKQEVNVQPEDDTAAIHDIAAVVKLDLDSPPAVTDSDNPDPVEKSDGGHDLVTASPSTSLDNNVSRTITEKKYSPKRRSANKSKLSKKPKLPNSFTKQFREIDLHATNVNAFIQYKPISIWQDRVVKFVADSFVDDCMKQMTPPQQQTLL